MTLQDKWKKTGKETGGAFANLGKSLGKTAQVTVGGQENKKDEDGNTELGNAWRTTGKSFGEAGKSFGQAMAGTAKKVVGKEEKEPKEETPKTENGGEVADEVI